MAIDYCEVGSFVTVAAAAVVIIIRAFVTSRCSTVSVCCGVLQCQKHATKQEDKGHATKQEDKGQDRDLEHTV